MQQKMSDVLSKLGNRTTAQDFQAAADNSKLIAQLNQANGESEIAKYHDLVAQCYQQQADEAKGSGKSESVS